MFEKLGKSLDQLWKEFQTGLAQFLLSFEFIRSQPDLDRFVSRVQSFLLVCIFFGPLIIGLPFLFLPFWIAVGLTPVGFWLMWLGTREV